LSKSKLLLGGAAALALCIAASSASAGVITFDNLGDNGSGTPIFNGYAGLQWNNFDVLDAVALANQVGPTGYSNGIVSSPKVAFNISGTPASFSSGTTFNLDDFYLTAAWSDGLTVQITGLIGGNPVDSATEVIDTSGPTHVMLNWSGIDEVDFVSFGGVQHGHIGQGSNFALDNLTLAFNGPTVPEPGTWAMLILGLGMVGFAARRRREGLPITA
jgi:hypothetical protein